MGDRRHYLITRLLSLDKNNKNLNLFGISLVELERLYIKELNKPLNIQRWRRLHGL